MDLANKLKVFIETLGACIWFLFCRRYIWVSFLEIWKVFDDMRQCSVEVTIRSPFYKRENLPVLLLCPTSDREDLKIIGFSAAEAQRSRFGFFNSPVFIEYPGCRFPRGYIRRNY